MVIFLLLLANIFSLSHQNVRAAFFCDDDIQDIYVVNGASKSKIADKISGSHATPYYYRNLAATPGDLIYFGCTNSGGSTTYAAGCFYIFDDCHCYMFNEVNGIKYTTSTLSRTADFGNNHICVFDTIQRLSEEKRITYYYQNYVPLDAKKVQCISNTISAPKDVISNVKISNFITASFDTKNVEVAITENNDYFTLNGVILQKNTIFKVTQNLNFKSTETKKITIKFTNYGKIISGTSSCEFYIRVCHERCSNCNANNDPSETNHQCTGCKNGFYLVENTNNCKTPNEMYEQGYYLDVPDGYLKKCYADCKTCSYGGNSNDMKCDSCYDSTKKYLAEPNNCISDITNYYYSTEDNRYKKCYSRCHSCYGKGTEGENNCKKCADQYHFIYNVERKCISESEKPSNTYLDISTNTYRLCYERCSTCDVGGDETNNNCKNCAKDFHFIYNETGKCISESEKPSNTYLDTATNTYKLCYDRCSTCDKGGDDSNNNCKECAKDTNNNYIYHFVYNETGKCLTESEKPSNTYLDKGTNTYRKCYDRCSTCNQKGDELNNNCKECYKDENNIYHFHFIYNELKEGNCIDENQKPYNTFLDLETNTYELCYDRCQSCSKKSDIVNNNCDECRKDDNNNYIYHFVENEEGKCITEKEKPLNTYFDSKNNIYRFCYDRCSLCDKPGDKDNNNCKECSKDENNNYSFHFLHDEKGKCISEDEKPPNTYLDLETNTYELCYEKCSTCDEKGDITNNNCKECLKDESNNYIYHFIYDKKGKCVNELERPLNSYLDKEDNTFKLCFERCSLCDRYGNEFNNNCNECAKDINNTYLYHFIFNETGICINETEKPSNTYLDLEDNTYKKCYDRCSSCFGNGSQSTNNCKDCLKDNNNNYLYHFIHNETGKCLSNNERPANTYLDIETNTYRLCNLRCKTCESFPECTECLKDESNNYIYHFIDDEKGKCIKESEIKNGFYYLDNNDNTYKICPEGTIKVENNECIETNDEKIILAFIIIITILIIVSLFFIGRMLFINRKRDNVMKELIIN